MRSLRDTLLTLRGAHTWRPVLCPLAGGRERPPGARGFPWTGWARGHKAYLHLDLPGAQILKQQLHSGFLVVRRSPQLRELKSPEHVL